MLHDITEYLKENGADSKDAAQDKINSEYALELGENLQLKDYMSIEAESIAAYVHSNAKLAAIVSATAGTDEEKLKQVAMHVTAANPEYVSPDEIPEEVVEKEKAIQLEIMKNDPNMGNKSDDVLLKIIEGKMGKFK
jgi:elongation factor Ts